MKVVLISAVTAAVVFVVLAAVLAGIYYSICCEPIGKGPSGGGPVEERPKEGRTTFTDAAKIASVSFRSWSHAGPLYPGPNEPSGYVLSESVEFRRDLSADRTTKKDFDRELPDESSSFSAQIAADQFATLIEACVKNDIINQPDSKEVRSEAGTTLVIEYDGTKKSIVTSNVGKDTAEVKDVLAVIERMKSSVQWTNAGTQ